MENAQTETEAPGGQSRSTAGLGALLPCPFCGGPVELEKAHIQRHEQFGERQFYGVVCRNTTNLGGTCCMEQVPSASKEAAIGRWNMRNGKAPNAIAQGREHSERPAGAEGSA